MSERKHQAHDKYGHLKKDMARRGLSPQIQDQNRHPDEFARDLNPNAMGGQNLGAAGPHPEKEARSAYDLKDIHRAMSEFTDDELKQIRIIPRGTRLEQNATYFDLANPGVGEFKATGKMVAGERNCFIAKSEIDYQLWNRLRGVGGVERTGKREE